MVTSNLRLKSIIIIIADETFLFEILFLSLVLILLIFEKVINFQNLIINLISIIIHHHKFRSVKSKKKFLWESHFAYVILITIFIVYVLFSRRNHVNIVRWSHISTEIETFYCCLRSAKIYCSISFTNNIEIIANIHQNLSSCNPLINELRLYQNKNQYYCRPTKNLLWKEPKQRIRMPNLYLAFWKTTQSTVRVCSGNCRSSSETFVKGLICILIL